MSMSKLARVLTLAATLAAINLVGMTAVAQAHTGEDPTSTRHRALGQVEVLATAAQPRATADATVRRLLARERFSVPDGAPTPAQPTSPVRPAAPTGRAGWLAPVLGVLAAVLALVAGIAVLATRRATRSQRAGQTA